MRKFLKLFAPVLTGILVILGILKADELVRDLLSANYQFNPTDMGDVVFYYVLIPLALLAALLIHWFIIQPVIKRLESKPAFWHLKLMHYIVLISLIAAAVVGYIFWRKTGLWDDVIVAFFTSFILFFIYFIVTVLFSKGIDHFEIHQSNHQPQNLNHDDQPSAKI